MQTDDADLPSIAVTSRHGLGLLGTHLESVLDLSRGLPEVSIDVAPLPLATASERDSTYALVLELNADTPDGGAVPREMFDDKLREPWQGLIARESDTTVGLTMAFARAEVGEANTMLTGIRRPWRGRGLSTQLKAAHSLVLRQHGFHRLRTQHMDINAAILAANDRLGFQRTGAYRDLSYDFTRDGST